MSTLKQLASLIELSTVELGEPVGVTCDCPRSYDRHAETRALTVIGTTTTDRTGKQ